MKNNRYYKLCEELANLVLKTEKECHLSREKAIDQVLCGVNYRVGIILGSRNRTGGVN